MNEQRLFAVASEPDEQNPGATKRGEMPLPGDIRTFLLAGIFTLLLFYALYVAGDIFVPILFALILKLLLMPPMRLLARLRVPKIVAAIVLIAALFGGASLVVYTVSGPAAGWAARVPESLAQLERRLHVLKEPVEQVQKATREVEKITGGEGSAATPVTVKGPGLGDYLVSGTRSLVAGLVTVVVLLFFLLVAGDLFLRRLVEILPSFKDKKQAVEISHEIESNISGYLFTITIMNTLVGAATAGMAQLCGLPDAVLWGAVAFLINYVPVLGPCCGVGLFFVVGLATFDTIWQAALPAASYLGIHLVEGEFVTPMLLARRFTLNPVLVMISLILWHWMWGMPGMLLAVPMLAAFKIVCDRVRPLMALGHFIGG